MKCKHKAVSHNIRTSLDGDYIVAFDACLDCEEWLPLGEANDSDERVMVEKELAALIAHMMTIPDTFAETRESLADAIIIEYRDGFMRNHTPEAAQDRIDEYAKENV